MTGCAGLVEPDNVWVGVSLASQKPQNVTVTAAGRASVTVSWEIHADFPTEVLTGFCVKMSHSSHGLEHEICPPRPTTTSALMTPCFDHDLEHLPGCLRGTVNFHVKLKTDCGVEHPYSDSVSYDFQW